MPTFTIPDNFTVSDDEFRASKQAQERVYSLEGGRQASSTYLDPLGHARWDTDYVTMRMAGYTHEQALQEMRVRIRESWRPSPLPATEEHVVVAPPPVVVPPGASALDRLRAAIRHANDLRPELAVVNRKASCFQLLHLAMSFLGPDFAYVGKTPDMDGDGKYAPEGFRPFATSGTRPDGQSQAFSVVALSMDAVWYLPERQQFKAIQNSTDGEPGGAGRPAQLNPYLIAAADYRWHNPPVAQALVP